MKPSEIDIQEKLDILAMGCAHVEELIYPYYLGWSAEDIGEYERTLLPYHADFINFTYLINVETSEIKLGGTLTEFKDRENQRKILKHEPIDTATLKYCYLIYTKDSTIYIVFAFKDKISSIIEIKDSDRLISIINNADHVSVLDVTDKIIILHFLKSITDNGYGYKASIIDKATKSLESLSNYASDVQVMNEYEIDLNMTINGIEHHYKQGEHQLYC